MPSWLVIDYHGIGIEFPTACAGSDIYVPGQPNNNLVMKN